MMDVSTHDRATLSLIAMPWATLNRPSIQLGTLKAWVEQKSNHLVNTHHPYLNIAKALGTYQYTRIADSSWGAEALFAALLFPQQFEGAQKTWQDSLGAKAKQLPDFSELVQTIQTCCEEWVRNFDVSDQTLIGATLCFNQLFSSLYLAQLLKDQAGCPPIVFGGSLCAGELGKSLLQTFHQIDYIVDGEGEKPLAALADYLVGRERHLPERILSRQKIDSLHPAPEIDDLNTLPTPDYSSYFTEVEKLFPDSPFIPVVPIEFSRGCWWNKCSFCNLNLQWCGYRHKTSTSMLGQLSDLAKRHECLDYTFADNALPPRETDSFFEAIAASRIDVRFFAEVRTIPETKKLLAYRRGGLETIQVGIESLSSPLLKKMKKGSRAIDNIAMMKAATAAGIKLEGNLIMEFPGSTSDEVTETLHHLDAVLPYHPLAPATFFLGHGSPVAHSPGKFGIHAITTHPHNKRLFPADIRSQLTLLIKDYRGDRQQQRKLWQPVRQKLDSWQHFHDTRRSATIPALSFRDGSTFLLIRQEVMDGPPLKHRLKGLSRKIYLFCDSIRTIEEVSSHFPNLTESAILAFVHQLVEKKLLFREEDRILALAIRDSNTTL